MISGINNAGEENSVPIPDWIADKLCDQKFKNFDKVRQKLWKEVSKFWVKQEFYTK